MDTVFLDAGAIINLARDLTDGSLRPDGTPHAQLAASKGALINRINCPSSYAVRHNSPLPRGLFFGGEADLS